MDGAKGDIIDRLQWFKENRAALALIILVNVGGIAYGFYYYALQFQLTSPTLWIFVPDSPLAVLWAQAALVLYWFGKRRSTVLESLAFVGNVQVGLWTAFVLIAYWDHFRIFTLNLNFVLFWLHLGMVALALLFVPDLRRSFRGNRRLMWTSIGAAAAWYLLNDVVDYFLRGHYANSLGTGCGLRPITVPCEPALEGITTAVTFGLTLGSAAALVWLTRPRAAPAAASTTSADAAR